MACQYRSPIPVGGGGDSLVRMNFYLPSLHVEDGEGGRHPVCENPKNRPFLIHVYVLFVHKKSVSKRKVCIIFIKNLKKKNIFSGFF